MLLLVVLQACRRGLHRFNNLASDLGGIRIDPYLQPTPDCILKLALVAAEKNRKTASFWYKTGRGTS